MELKLLPELPQRLPGKRTGSSKTSGSSSSNALVPSHPHLDCAGDGPDAVEVCGGMEGVHARGSGLPIDQSTARHLPEHVRFEIGELELRAVHLPPRNPD